jgi:adenosyl cobinamide kinase/adenosyl cobinamide phosphate guanylyltransferase
MNEYQTVDINVSKEDLKELKKIAKNNKVTLNQVICDGLSLYLYRSIFENEERWELLRKEFTKKNASKDTMKIVNKIFQYK